MPWLNMVLVAFSLLNIGLGVYGYSASGSAVSLIAGVAIGILMLGTVALAKVQPRIARIASLILSLAVIGRFLPKFLETQDWLPAGILSLSAIAVALCLVGGHIAAMSGRRSTPSAE
jgi:uncharacterized membrane protein (UPF0136 family)